MLKWLGMGLAALLLLGQVALAQDEMPQIIQDRTPDQIHPVWSDFQPHFTPYICPFVRTAMYDEGEYRCGYVLVPEDRTRADSRLIRLSVLKIATIEDAATDTAMIRLTGGPGGTSLSMGRINAYKSGGNRGLRRHGDLIFFDQRGTGYSEGNICRAVPMPYQYGRDSYAEGKAAFWHDIELCFAEAGERGISIDGYTTWQNALDVRDIRRALGYDNWTLFGVSYGTELAQAVMQVDADGTRAAILDSIVPAGYATNDMLGLFASGFQSALTAAEAMCEADAACAKAYPGMAGRFIAAFESYDAEPLELTGLNKAQAVGGQLTIDGTLAANAVFQALYDKRIFGDLPALLSVLESRDADALSTYVNELGYPIDHRYGRGMSITMNCRGGFREVPDAMSAPIQTGTSMKAWMEITHFYDECDRVIDPSADPASRGPLVTDIPILLAAGTVDPITPPYYADHALRGFSNATLATFPHTGHGGLVSNWAACGRPLIDAFLADPAAELDVSCAAATPAPDMLVKFRRTAAPYAFARKLQSGAYPKAAMGAGLISLLILIGFPMGLIARQFDARSVFALGGARRWAWGGAALSLTGAALGVMLIIKTATEHSATLPIGVVPTISIAGWLGLAGLTASLIGLIQMLRKLALPGPPVGSLIAVGAGAAASLALFSFLLSIGAGPF